MTDREINKAIAEHLGWKSSVKQWFCSKDGGESGWLFDDYKEKCKEYLKDIKETDWRYGSTIHPSMSLPPKYCEDLNLMHEAEKALTSMQQDEYWDFLWNLTGSEFELCHANARQRAEAFLKTVGKWVETVKIQFEKVEIKSTGRKLHPAWRYRKIEPREEGMELGGFEVYFDEKLADTMPEYDHLRPKFDEEEQS